jgi:hypothetical protein
MNEDPRAVPVGRGHDDDAELTIRGLMRATIRNPVDSRATAKKPSTTS